VREVWHPDTDLVRRSWPGTDDPAGGVLDQAPDRVTLRRRGQPASASRRSVISSA
jgi:hypothetical protein